MIDVLADHRQPILLTVPSSLEGAALAIAFLDAMARPEGFEPPTFRSEVCGRLLRDLAQAAFEKGSYGGAPMNDEERHVVQHVAATLRDPDVAELLVAWSSLPVHVRLTIRVLLDSTGPRDEPSEEPSPPFLTGCFLG